MIIWLSLTSSPKQYPLQRSGSRAHASGVSSPPQIPTNYCLYLPLVYFPGNAIPFSRKSFVMVSRCLPPSEKIKRPFLPPPSPPPSFLFPSFFVVSLSWRGKPRLLISPQTFEEKGAAFPEEGLQRDLPSLFPFLQLLSVFTFSLVFALTLFELETKPSFFILPRPPLCPILP